MTRIRKTGTYLIIIFNILLAIIPVVALIKILFLSSPPENTFLSELLQESIQTPEGSVDLTAIHWTDVSKLIVACATLLTYLPFFLGLFPLKSIFKNYQKNEIFTQANAKHYRYLGWLFFLNALFAKPISSMLMTLVATLSNPPGHRYLVLNFGTPNLEALFSGILIIVISWVMLEASKIHDEQKFTI